jgi:hypothetical protein
MVHIAIHFYMNLDQLFESVKRIDLIDLPLKTGSTPAATVIKKIYNQGCLKSGTPVHGKHQIIQSLGAFSIDCVLCWIYIGAKT